METIRPRRCSRMRRVACRGQLKGPFRWAAVTASHSSSLMLKIIRSRRMPALFTRMSIAPNSLTAVSTMRSAAAKSATLSALATALPPRVRIASTTSSATRREAPRPSTSAPRSFTTTAAPSAASSSAIARPMPGRAGGRLLRVGRQAGGGEGAGGVPGDAVLPGGARRHLGGPADRRFRSAVVRLPGITEQARAGAEGDDSPVAPLAHVRARVAHAVEGALQVHPDDRVPLLLAHVEDHAVAQDAGAGDERVEAAPGLERRADEARGTVPGGDRIGVGNSLAAD